MPGVSPLPEEPMVRTVPKNRGSSPAALIADFCNKICHFRTPAPQYSGPLSDHLIGVMPLRDPPALPRAPHRGRETRLAGRHLVRPNDDLFAVLPLDRYRFVSGLVAALIDGEIAKDRLRLEGQQGFPQLFRV